eukprot:Platyproteum_vivax@DN4875_c0_g1_i1.p1
MVMIVEVFGSVVYAAGCIALLAVTVRVVERIFSRMQSQPIKIKQLGRWAVVTGCTDGIGKALALQLWLKGLSIFMLSRSEDKLKETEKEFRGTKSTGDEIKFMAIDFATAGDAEYAKVKEELAKLEIAILINNAGVSYPHAQYLDEVEEDTMKSLVAVNCNAMWRLTKAVLPGMKERKQGIIVNISSGDGVLPSAPLYAGYAASKAFIEGWTRSLEVECRESNVTAHTLFIYVYLYVLCCRAHKNACLCMFL